VVTAEELSTKQRKSSKNAFCSVTGFVRHIAAIYHGGGSWSLRGVFFPGSGELCVRTTKNVRSDRARRRTSFVQ